MPPAANVHVGVAAWVESPRGLLLIQRGGEGEYASDGRGTWSLPGGWLEFGEAPEEAAAREAREEAGVILLARSRMGYVCCPSDNGEFQIVTLFVRCELASGSPEPHVTEPDKCPHVGWYEPHELKFLRLFAPVKAWLGEQGRGQR